MSGYPPTDEQRAILESLHGPLRIAAGAGTGKTDTLRLAIVELISRGVRPGEILCLTFTVEATQEMRRRVVAAFAGREDIDADEITVQTYHAFAASVVHEHALLAGLDGAPLLLDQARKWQLALESLERASFSELEIRWLPTFVGRLLTLHEEIQRNDLSLEQVTASCDENGASDVARRRGEAVRALARYVELARERNAIDFGDQIRLANELLRARPEILARLRSRFRYVFLDEYQDTDVAQRALVRLLGTGAELVCAVGDVDQGIFGWRGATIHNMFAFGDDFPGAVTRPLSLNFRSGGRILELANALITPFQPPEDYEREPLRPAAGAPEATVEAFVARHSEEEAEQIAERVAAGGEPWSSYAVLVRKRAQLDPVFRALAARDIPVEVDTLGGFWMRPEIVDVRAWLEVLADPEDNIALARILLGPGCRLSRRDLYFLADHAKGQNRELRRTRVGDRDVLRYSLIDSIVGHEEIADLSDEARARIERIRELWCTLARTADRVSLADLVGEIARATGLAGELAASPEQEAEQALHHLAKLRDLAQAYQPVAGSADLRGFVAYLDSVEESDQDEDELRAVEPNAVRLMTIYRGKGLEWDTVFVPGLADKLMPSERRSENPADRWYRLPFALRGDRDFLPDETDAGLAKLKAEEDRRLMYVAVTRAKRRLVLSRAWFYWDNRNARGPSLFWSEALDTGLVRLTGDAQCPDANPFAGQGAAAVDRHPTERVRDADAIARTEPEVERLRAVEARTPRASAWRCPSTISVTAFLTFVRDEEEFFWRYVRRVPMPPSPAAKLGIDVHRRIEEHARGGVPVALPADDEEPYDLDPGERREDGERVSAEQMWQNFLASRFARMTPVMTEQPFTLHLGEGLSVTGRIDAIFEGDDGAWEVVDYKTGRSEPDPLQVELYRRAVEVIWAREATCSWLLLRDTSERPAEPVADFEALMSRALPRMRRLEQASAA